MQGGGIAGHGRAWGVTRAPIEEGSQNGTAGKGQRVVARGFAWCWRGEELVLGSAGGCGASTVLKLSSTCTQAAVCTSTCAAGGVWWKTAGLIWGPHGINRVLLSSSRTGLFALLSSLVCFCVKQACLPLLPHTTSPPPFFFLLFPVDPGSFLHILRENLSQSLAADQFLPGLGAWFGNRCSVQPEILCLESALMAPTPHQGHQRKGIFFVRFQFRCDWNCFPECFSQTLCL